jgi:hypothetical protein
VPPPPPLRRGPLAARGGSLAAMASYAAGAMYSPRPASSAERTVERL